MKNKGITLIALVVTIVVLLILAGITISLVFSSNGVIKKAQDSKEQTEIGEMRDKLEMAKVPVYADGNGTYKVQDYWSRIESEGLITGPEDIINNGDGTYQVTTTPGYVFEITVEPNKEIAENIIIGNYLGKGENLSIGIRLVNVTTNSIEIEVVRAEGASNFKYSIKKQGEEYGIAEEKSEKTHTFNGLNQGEIYTVKVEATKNGERQEVERTIQVGEIPTAINGDIRWTGNGQAEVRIYTNETGYQLEWQKGGISEGSWTREATGVKEKTITGLKSGDIIYARLYDGVSSGKYANIEVMDNTPPEITKFEATEITTSSIEVKVEANDDESGLDIKETYQYYIGDKLKATNTSNNYRFNDLKDETKYVLKVIVKNGAGKTSEKTISLVTNKALPIEDVLKTDKITYVNYIDSKDVTRKCAVLYDSNSPYGIEIITMDTVGGVTIGNSSDFTASMNSYNGAISTLNSKASTYNNSIYSDRARCVGSVPSSPNTQAGMRKMEFNSNYNNKIRDVDDNYLTDYNQMMALDIAGIGKNYCFASRYADGGDFYAGFGMRGYGSGLTAGNNICYLNRSFTDSNEIYSALRPVFRLKPEVKITGGDGTEENPYTLGV